MRAETTSHRSDARSDNALFRRLQSMAGVDVAVFDYGDWSSRWVTNDHIGPKLADAVDCPTAKVAAAKSSFAVTPWANSSPISAGLIGNAGLRRRDLG